MLWNDTPISVLHLAPELLNCNFRELVAIDREFVTCDNHMTDWYKSSVDILNEMSTEKEKYQWQRESEHAILM
jgi:hypothetical protein